MQMTAGGYYLIEHCADRETAIARARAYIADHPEHGECSGVFWHASDPSDGFAGADEIAK